MKKKKEKEAWQGPCRAADLSCNPPGTDRKVARQREREKGGRFRPVGDKLHTLVFVRDGEDAEKRVAAYLDKISRRPGKWN